MRAKLAVHRKLFTHGLTLQRLNIIYIGIGSAFGLHNRCRVLLLITATIYKQQVPRTGGGFRGVDNILLYMQQAYSNN